MPTGFLEGIGKFLEMDFPVEVVTGRDLRRWLGPRGETARDRESHRPLKRPGDAVQSLG